MNLTARIVAIAAIALIPAFADNVPIAGNTTGTFSASGTDVWTYGGSSNLTFSGNSFSLFNNCIGLFFTCTTPALVDLGTLTDSNSRSDNTTQDLTTTLRLVMSFTTPTGGAASFSGTVGMDENCRSDGHVDCVTDLSNFDPPPSYSFTIGGEQYTVTLDGFYQGSNGPLPGLTTENGGSNSADLWATVTSQAATVPEPTSVLLLGSVGGMVAMVARKRRRA